MQAAASSASRISGRMDGLLGEQRKVGGLVPGRSGETVYAWLRASALGGQAELLPRFYAAGEMRVVRQACGLRHQRGGNRPVAGAAGRHDAAGPRVRGCRPDGSPAWAAKSLPADTRL